jgi:hypothetical protein
MGAEDFVQLGEQGGFGERFFDQVDAGFEDALCAEETGLGAVVENGNRCRDR